jgi:hypothetical protein
MTNDKLQRQARLAELEADIRDSQGLISSEQEMEIEALLSHDAGDAIDIACSFEQKAERLELIMKRAKVVLGLLEERAAYYRAKAVKNMVAGGVKSLKHPGGLWTASLTNGKGRVELRCKVEDLPEEFRRPVVTFKPETDLLRMALEMGRDIHGPDGFQAATIVKEPHLRVLKNQSLMVGEELREAIE